MKIEELSENHIIRNGKMPGVQFVGSILNGKEFTVLAVVSN
jgi:hypothetical protein